MDIGVRRFAMRVLQKLNRRANPMFTELVYQASFYERARNTDWISCPPHSSPRGGTASYALLYTLLDVLDSSRPAVVLELGAGASTALTSAYSESNPDVSVTVLDHDRKWLDFAARGGLPTGLNLVHSPLRPVEVIGRRINWYDWTPDITGVELLIVDGPPAWKKLSRYDRTGILPWLPEIMADEFIIVIDDIGRCGEAELYRRAVGEFENKVDDINVTAISAGNTLGIIATQRFERHCYV